MKTLFISVSSMGDWTPYEWRHRMCSPHLGACAHGLDPRVCGHPGRNNPDARHRAIAGPPYYGPDDPKLRTAEEFEEGSHGREPDIGQHILGSVLGFLNQVQKSDSEAGPSIGIGPGGSLSHIEYVGGTPVSGQGTPSIPEVNTTPAQEYSYIGMSGSEAQHHWLNFDRLGDPLAPRSPDDLDVSEADYEAFWPLGTWFTPPGRGGHGYFVGIVPDRNFPGSLKVVKAQTVPDDNQSDDNGPIRIRSMAMPFQAGDPLMRKGVAGMPEFVAAFSSTCYPKRDNRLSYADFKLMRRAAMGVDRR